jgi:hypothetical protein
MSEQTPSAPKLTAYALVPEPPQLVPASATRRWMDEFPDRHPYRCLPLSIANAHGWCLLSPCTFQATWTGGPGSADIRIAALDDFPYLNHIVQSNFSRGILTFHTGYLFRTSPGWNLWAGGPANYFKQNAAPLTGVIETSWLPYPFTMNWQLTEPGTYRWERGEPYCMIFPVPAATLENVTPEIRDLSSDPPLHEQCLAWRERRFEHMQEFKPGDPDTLKDAWQRYYFLGRLPTGELVDHHVSKLRLHEPVDRRHSDASKRDDAARKQRDES